MNAKSSQITNTKTSQVVLLHGLGRLPGSIKKMADELVKQNYRVLNIGYNSLFHDYTTIISHLERKINLWIDNDAPIHFVGHSFGGILIRGLLAAHPEWHQGRCVLIGTPNKGTQTASFMCSHWLFKNFLPKVAPDLTPDSQLIKTLPEPEIETGIIAGNVKFSLLIPVSWYYKKATQDAPGDGIVEISNTQCRNMADFIIMPLHHSFMTWDSKLIEEVIHFLQFGKFTSKYKSDK